MTCRLYIGGTALLTGLAAAVDYNVKGQPTVRNIMVPAAYAGASRGTILATRGWTFRSLRYAVYLTVAETVILSLIHRTHFL